MDEHKSCCSDTLDKAREWLCQAGNRDGSFGTTPPLTHPDLDDTAIALMGLPLKCEARDRTLRLLRYLQNEDGSWGTFPSFNGEPPNLESSFPVYIQSLDVTIHAVEGLRKQGLPISDPCFLKAIRWILAQQKNDGLFESVWFEGPIYGTAQAVDLLNNLKFRWNMLKMSRQVNQVRQKGMNFLLDQYNSKGDWGNSVAETALAISALKSKVGNNRLIIDKAIESILVRQTETGSFIPTYQGVYAKGWNYEEPLSTALTAIRALGWYVKLSD